MDDLQLANKTDVFEKLANLVVVRETIRCNDLIDAISTSVSRDKRLINNYTPEQMIKHDVQVGNTLRSCRMFTMEGIKRYVHEGKIYSYKNVCEYFGLSPIDPLIAEMDKCKVPGSETFMTKKMLKWLFDKRKQTKELKSTVSLDKLRQWLVPYKNQINSDKYKLLAALQLSNTDSQ